MKANYYTLLYCGELEKSQSSDVMLGIVRERVKHSEETKRTFRRHDAPRACG